MLFCLLSYGATVRVFLLCFVLSFNKGGDLVIRELKIVDRRSGSLGAPQIERNLCNKCGGNGPDEACASGCQKRSNNYCKRSLLCCSCQFSNFYVLFLRWTKKKHCPLELVCQFHGAHSVIPARRVMAQTCQSLDH